MIISRVVHPQYQCKSYSRPKRNATGNAKKKTAPQFRRLTAVRASAEEEDMFDMSAIGLDDVYDLVDAAESASIAAWLPGTYAPEYLDGKTYPADYGFDPLGLGASGNVEKYREVELIHARWAMLGVTGMVSVEAFGQGSWLEAPLWAVNGGMPTYFGIEVPFDLKTILAIEFIGMAFVELKRGASTEGAPYYPGGPFDPLGFSKASEEDLRVLQTNEIANGRVAMLAALGFFTQAYVTGTSPLTNLMDHMADPWGTNIATAF